MSHPLDASVDVPLWVVVYAIRYAAGRSSYAHGDAHTLFDRYRARFPNHIVDQITGDFAAAHICPRCVG